MPDSERDHRPTFAPCGVVTLTTDFGHRDPFVGVMKGVLLTRHPQGRIVDLTHEIEKFWPDEAGFWLGRSYRYFPRGTVHVAVVDPGVGTNRAIVSLEGDGHVFLAPDNGLLAAVLSRLGEAPAVRRIDVDVRSGLQLDSISATFHGRDVFAPIAAELASGRLSPRALGPVIPELVAGAIAPPLHEAGRATCQVVAIDHFGNLLTNLEGNAAVASQSGFEVEVAGRVIGSGRTYGDVASGEYVALVNSFGVVEIARRGGDAAAGLGIGRGARVQVRPAP